MTTKLIKYQEPLFTKMNQCTGDQDCEVHMGDCSLDDYDYIDGYPKEEDDPVVRRVPVYDNNGKIECYALYTASGRQVNDC